uniref:Uncharacterized protein n=1 Tax=viral metagenome TaxID=1070528 RepID=A0A6M3J8Z0_9ZZZZ
MDAPSFGDLSVGAIVAILILDRVFSFLKGRSRGEAVDDQMSRVNGSLGAAVHRIEKRVERTEEGTLRLVDQHSKTDAQGVPLWYDRSSQNLLALTKAVERLGENVATQTTVLGESLRSLRESDENFRNAHRDCKAAITSQLNEVSRAIRGARTEP